MIVHTACRIWAKPFLACLLLTAISTTAAEGEAESLITELTLLEQTEVGLSPVMCGFDFPPVSGGQQLSVWLQNRPGKHAIYKPFLRLVELGPAALPALLSHLDDKRETKLQGKNAIPIGSMWHALEVPAPQGENNEIEAIQKEGIKQNDYRTRSEHISEHHVTVGDVCFVIIGMITNRHYNAVRYQPSGCVVVNSPTFSPKIANAVRSIWKEPEMTQALHDRLLRDLVRKESDYGTDLGAATRLLYYYPEDTSVKVLTWLNAAIQTDSQELAYRVGAVAWSNDTAIRQTVQNLVQKTERAEVAAAGAKSFQSASIDTTLKLMNRWKSTTQGQGAGAGVRFFEVALGSHPDSQGRIVDTYALDAGDEVLAFCIPVLYELARPPVKSLAPLLSNQAAGVGQFIKDGAGVHKAPREDHCINYRICDNIYEIICRALGDRDTSCTGTYQEMDVKIKDLQSRFKLEPSAWPFSGSEIRSRQKAQNAKKDTRDQLLERIHARAKSPVSAWLLTLAEDGLEPEDWNDAAFHLMRAEGSEEKRPFDSLTEEEQVRVGQMLSQRLADVLDRAPADARPSFVIANIALFLCRCPNGHTQPVLARLVQTMETTFHKHGWPEKDDLDTTIRLLDLLTDSRVKGAVEYYFQLVQAATPQRLEGSFDALRFFEIMVKGRSTPVMIKAAEWCFGQPQSSWKLSEYEYENADILGNAKLLSLPAFRTSLIEALAHTDIVGELSLKKERTDYYQIQWKKGGRPGRREVNEAEPAEIKSGQTMPIRRCDAILEGVANAFFAEKKGPPFHIYWPLEKRDEGIQQWIRFLKEMK